MRCSYTLQELVRLLCGGSALWLAATFCSPVAAVESTSPATASGSGAAAAKETYAAACEKWEADAVMGVQLTAPVNGEEGTVGRPEHFVRSDLEGGQSDGGRATYPVNGEEGTVGRPEHFVRSDLEGGQSDGGRATYAGQERSYFEESSDEASAVAEAGLFARQPDDLLEASDIELIRSLRQIPARSSDLRRERLSGYIEGLGFRGIDLAYRYEDAVNAEAVALADDLAGVAALLACYRLVERGQVGTNEAVALLENAVSEPSREWVERVGQISEESDGTVRATHPVVGLMAATADRSIEGLRMLVSAASSELARLPWAELAGRLREIRAAFRPLGRDSMGTY
ncbi:MAG: hypothetical protein ACYC6Y_02635 [Thermoguttaceae bacterium]